MKDDSDAPTKLYHVGRTSQDIQIGQFQRSAGVCARNNVVHSVDPFEQSTFPATAGTDKRGHAILRNFQSQIVQRLKVAVPGRKVLDLNHRFSIRIVTLRSICKNLRVIR